MTGFKSKRMMVMDKLQAYSERHGGPYDRGAADAYYRRSFAPHYFEGDTYQTPRIHITDKNSEEYKAYLAGWNDTMDAGNFKDWG